MTTKEIESLAFAMGFNSSEVGQKIERDFNTTASPSNRGLQNELFKDYCPDKGSKLELLSKRADKAQGKYDGENISKFSRLLPEAEGKALYLDAPKMKFLNKYEKANDEVLSGMNKSLNAADKEVKQAEKAKLKAEKDLNKAEKALEKAQKAFDNEEEKRGIGEASQKSWQALQDAKNNLQLSQNVIPNATTRVENAKANAEKQYGKCGGDVEKFGQLQGLTDKQQDAISRLISRIERGFGAPERGPQLAAQPRQQSYRQPAQQYNPQSMQQQYNQFEPSRTQVGEEAGLSRSSTLSSGVSSAHDYSRDTMRSESRSMESSVPQRDQGSSMRPSVLPANDVIDAVISRFQQLSGKAYEGTGKESARSVGAAVQEMAQKGQLTPASKGPDGAYDIIDGKCELNLKVIAEQIPPGSDKIVIPREKFNEETGKMEPVMTGGDPNVQICDVVSFQKDADGKLLKNENGELVIDKMHIFDPKSETSIGPNTRRNHEEQKRAAIGIDPDLAEEVAKSPRSISKMRRDSRGRDSSSSAAPNRDSDYESIDGAVSRSRSQNSSMRSNESSLSGSMRSRSDGYMNVVGDSSQNTLKSSPLQRAASDAPNPYSLASEGPLYSQVVRKGRAPERRDSSMSKESEYMQPNGLGAIANQMYEAAHFRRNSNEYGSIMPFDEDKKKQQGIYDNVAGIYGNGKPKLKDGLMSHIKDHYEVRDKALYDDIKGQGDKESPATVAAAPAAPPLPSRNPGMMPEGSLQQPVEPLHAALHSRAPAERHAAPPPPPSLESLERLVQKSGDGVGSESKLTMVQQLAEVAKLRSQGTPVSQILSDVNRGKQPVIPKPATVAERVENGPPYGNNAVKNAADSLRGSMKSASSSHSVGSGSSTYVRGAGQQSHRQSGGR